MKIRIISDIHLEYIINFNKFINMFVELPCVDILIMAGDITTYNNLHNKFINFIDCIRPHYKYIIYVLGNREYYGYDDKLHGNIINEYKKICIKKDIILLENNFITLDDKIKIGGTTLWSPVSEKASYYSNDCCYLTRKNIHNMNNIAIDWIKKQKQTETNSSKPFILITHHLPSYKFVVDKYKKLDNTGFANDNFDDLFSKLHISHWIFGHTHYPIDKKIENINFICNPFGYPDENLKFKRNLILYDKVIEIE